VVDLVVCGWVEGFWAGVEGMFWGVLGIGGDVLGAEKYEPKSTGEIEVAISDEQRRRNVTDRTKPFII
jgi:hypothetical protein